MRSGAIKITDKRNTMVSVDNKPPPLGDKRNTTMNNKQPALVEMTKKLTRSASIAIPATAVKENVEPKARSSDTKEVISRSSNSPIADIDACDEDNPLHAAEYVRDIYRYLFYLEVGAGVVSVKYWAFFSAANRFVPTIWPNRAAR
jgi:hypothetical protein